MTMFLRCLLVALVAAGAAARTAGTEKTEVQKAFEKYGLVPDPVKVAPMYQFNAKYESGAVPKLGNELSLSQVQKIPVTISYPADCKSFYTIVFIDPDFKKDSDDADDNCTQYLHYLVVNVPGDQVAKGRIVSKYVAPQPETGSGYHRYTAVVYKQSEWMQKNSCVITDRESFSLNEFVVKYRLGKPVAGSFFTARSEEDCEDADLD